MTIAEALKRESASVVAIIGTFEIVLNYLSQVVLMGDSTDTYSIIGASVVLCCIVAVTLESNQRSEYASPEEQDAEPDGGKEKLKNSPLDISKSGAQ